MAEDDPGRESSSADPEAGQRFFGFDDDISGVAVPVELPILPLRGVVIFRITNAGAVEHDFEIKGRKTRLLSHGQSATLRVSFLRKGHYPYKCTVAGHAAAGMKGVFTIT